MGPALSVLCVRMVVGRNHMAKKERKKRQDYKWPSGELSSVLRTMTAAAATAEVQQSVLWPPASSQVGLKDAFSFRLTMPRGASNSDDG